MSESIKSSVTHELLRLQTIVKKLRAPDGCPWDKEQTPQSLIPYLIEETYEVVEALENEDSESLKSELGDLLLHVVMQGEMAEEAEGFTLRDSLFSINEKLIRRHPHVFGEDNSEQGRHNDATSNWEKSKKAEGRKSWLDGVPKNLPGLIRAQRIQEKASQVGFDWNEVLPALEKFHEEIDELIVEWEAGEKDRAREEFGDVLFALVNVARLMKFDSESTMRLAIDKFDARFRALELEYERNDWDLEAATLEEMDAVWDRIKHKVDYRK
ncbi:MAG: nucleoside triphosphate pyrophosphohydrolase [Candidatus Marinimicrobia bacterium]|nr:nucleoside triphosphate pyrophosphohydrolase [Candidatus Neomarinimicrobiota bacterium]MCF7850353.1 nucleoside triphosphate pyrophosphohydrolase [Candidatus Neomarinimicrobiota bacterium]MCF7904924.1 nucleoside triphosphate pyrophosphohydrolase [Candidatus Neomarinimicrobiota bacterium]